MIPAFRNCSASPRAGLDDDRDGVRRLGDVGLGLADADRLDHDDVERVRQRLRRRAGRGGEPAEPLAGGHRADEDVAVGAGRARSARGRRAARRRCASRTGRPRARRPTARARATRAAAPQQRRLADARRPGDADDVPAPSPAAETSAARLLARGARLEQVERRRRALRSPAASRAPSAAPSAAPRQAARRRASRPPAATPRPRRRCARDQGDDVVHDPVELEVLRRVDRGDARGAQLGDVGVGDDAADHDRDVGAVQRRDHVRDQLAVRAAQDREADHVHALVDGASARSAPGSAGCPRRRRPCRRRGRGRRSARRRWSARPAPACRRGSSACARAPRCTRATSSRSASSAAGEAASPTPVGAR